MKGIRLAGCILVWVLIWVTSLELVSQDTTRARAFIRELGSPRLAGRGYTANGDRKASALIRNRLEKGGLEFFPGGPFQRFPIHANTFPGKALMEIDGRSLVPGKDFTAFPGNPGLCGTFPIVYVDSSYTFQADSFFAMFAGPKERKVVVVDSTGFSSGPMKYLVRDLRTGRLPGLAGVIELGGAFPFFHVSSNLDPVPAFRAAKGVITKADQLIRLDIQNRYLVDYKTRNVAALLRGSIDSFIVFTAHYDHIGQFGKTCHFPGANDNASGVALVLDLAEFLKEHEASLRYSCLFLFFSGEELGLLGSEYFCKNPLVDLKRIKMLFNLDMIGTGDEGFAVVNGKEYPDLERAFNQMNDSARWFPPIQYRGPASNSDHAPFFRMGVKSVFIYTKGQYRAYHQLSDHPDLLPLKGYPDLLRFLMGYCSTYLKLFTQPSWEN